MPGASNDPRNRPLRPSTGRCSIDQPNDGGEQAKGERECSPKIFFFAHPTEIDEDDPQAIEGVQQEEEEQEDIKSRIEVGFFSRTQPLRQVRHFAARSPAGVNLYWNQQEEENSTEALDQPGPGAAIGLEALVDH